MPRKNPKRPGTSYHPAPEPEDAPPHPTPEHAPPPEHATQPAPTPEHAPPTSTPHPNPAPEHATPPPPKEAPPHAPQETPSPTPRQEDAPPQTPRPTPPALTFANFITAKANRLQTILDAGQLDDWPTPIMLRPGHTLQPSAVAETVRSLVNAWRQPTTIGLRSSTRGQSVATVIEDLVLLEAAITRAGAERGQP